MNAVLFTRRPRRAGHFAPVFVGLTLTCILMPGCRAPEEVATGQQARSSVPMRAPAPPPAGEPTKTTAADKPAASDIGLPIYPYARAYGGGSPAITPNTAGVQMSLLVTDDAPDRVIAFYQERMPNAERAEDTADGKRVTRFSETHPEEGNGLRSVEISQENGQTHIALINVSATQNADTLFKSPAAADTPAGVSPGGTTEPGGAAMPGERTPPAGSPSAAPPDGNRSLPSPPGLPASPSGSGAAPTAPR
jgi:hypothetical protein